MMINTKYLVNTAYLIICAISFLASRYARKLLMWTIGDNSLFPDGTFIFDYFWIIHIAILLFAVASVFLFKRFAAGIIMWFVLNLIFWQFAITFACLSLATQNTEIRVDGIQVGKMNKN